MVMLSSYRESNIELKEYMEDKIMDISLFESLKDNSMLKVKPELWKEWNFKRNEKLDLDIFKITKGSDKKPWWKCLECSSEYTASVSHRINSNSGCPYCSGRKVNHTNNLMAKNPELASEWHPTLNDISPLEVTGGTNKKVWWKCKNNHEWRALISSRNYGINCPYCSNQKTLKGYNDIATTNKKLFELLLNKEDGYKYTQNSNKKVDWKCLNCGEILKGKMISDINKSGISCYKCSDGYSYPSKVLYNLLKSIDGMDFIKELSNTTFKWVGNKRYDFYIPSLNCIIETHGEQHYRDSFSKLGGRTSSEERHNDIIKKELAISNGVDFYIELDCRYSNIEYIKNSILKSDLIEIMDLNDIDWENIAINSEKSLVLEACNMWNEGITIGEIMEKLKLSSYGAQRYLERGVELNICNYNTSESRSRSKYKAKENVTNELLSKIAKLWNDNIVLSEIMLETNLSKSTVYRYINKGIKNGTCIGFDKRL